MVIPLLIQTYFRTLDTFLGVGYGDMERNKSPKALAFPRVGWKVCHLDGRREVEV